ncbi:TetR/AcrR family transcriptional regulator [uncultured Alsobacter sp.]|uniref:TetR/AcrR family transcriptional regulator n=1 Tax=uncultured Alsobacter sp. TaxID=1748258 RepID=UPI0025EC28A1|nr:TetR/AcrR family transcriptional regulator [uncultured Alsobacter sp.]
MSVQHRSPEAARQRRDHILEAAERCFVRSGFHRSTMQDVAAEAGMSAGNLYRYFASKEAIVSGLAERDREMLTADFAAMGTATDFLTAFEAVGRKHLIEEPREKAILVVEIWSEASRNPNIAAMCRAFDGEVHNGMRMLFSAAKAAGMISPSTDVDMAAQMMLTIADGLVKRRALEPGFDGERELAMAMTIFRAVFAGLIPTATAGIPSPDRPEALP